MDCRTLLIRIVGTVQLLVATALGQDVVFTIDSIIGMPRQSMILGVRVHDPDKRLGHILHDMLLPPDLRVILNEQGRASCREFVALSNQGFVRIPAACADAEQTCDGVRAVVGTQALGGFGHDKIIYSCDVMLEADATVGVFPIEWLFVDAVDIAAQPLSIGWENGELTVLPPCYGDCDGNGEVTIDELVTSVRISLGETPMEDCAITDLDRSRRAEIHELILAVNSGLAGCDTAEGEP